MKILLSVFFCFGLILPLQAKTLNTPQQEEVEYESELNDAQIFEQQMLAKKRQNYKPRKTTKRTSGRRSSGKRKEVSKSNSSGYGTNSSGMPSLNSGMFVK